MITLAVILILAACWRLLTGTRGHIHLSVHGPGFATFLIVLAVTLLLALFEWAVARRLRAPAVPTADPAAGNGTPGEPDGPYAAIRGTPRSPRHRARRIGALAVLDLVLFGVWTAGYLSGFLPLQHRMYDAYERAEIRGGVAFSSSPLPDPQTAEEMVLCVDVRAVDLELRPWEEKRLSWALTRVFGNNAHWSSFRIEGGPDSLWSAYAAALLFRCRAAGLPAPSLDDCLRKVVHPRDAYVPVGAYYARSRGEPIWIVDLAEVSGDETRLCRPVLYAFRARDGRKLVGGEP